MHNYEELKDMLCRELDKISEEGELTAGSLDVVEKLTHSLKSLSTIMAMEEYGDEYSYRSDGGMSNARNGGRSNRGYSYARGRRGNVRRDSMGRYSRDGGYSYAREDMVEDLRELMMDAPDEQTRQEFQRFISKVEKM